jgi:uncharacterized protein DUF3310
MNTAHLKRVGTMRTTIVGEPITCDKCFNSPTWDVFENGLHWQLVCPICHEFSRNLIKAERNLKVCPIDGARQSSSAAEQIPIQDPRTRQVGGSHYASKTTHPWDLIDAYNLNYHEGAAIKYIARNREKNGVEDLRKAIHEIVREIWNREKSIGEGAKNS